MNAMSPPPPGDDDDDDRRWNFLVGLIAIIVIVVIGFFIVWKIWQNEKMQECLVTGRRDCAAVDIPESR